MLLLTRNEGGNNEVRAEWYTLSQFFIFFFAIIFTVVSSQPLTKDSLGGYEQWRNVLTDFFLGQQDFLFSYGPLFWLTGQTVIQYSELAFWFSASFVSFYFSLMAAVLLRIALKHRCVFILGVIYFAILQGRGLIAIYFTFPLFLLVYLRSIKQERWLSNNIVLVGLAAFTSFMFYMRFFYGTVTLLTFGSYFFVIHILQKKIKPVVIFFIAFLVLYLLIGWCVFHNAESIKNYLLVNSQLSFGNSIDMTYDVSINKKAWLIIGLVIIVFNLFLIKERSPFLLTINGLFLIFLKLGFSRADHYISYFISPVALMAIICSTGVYQRWRYTSHLIVFLLLMLGSISIYPNSPVLPWLKVHEDFNQSPAQRAANTYPQFKLPEEMLAEIGNSTIDVYPYQNEYLLSNKLNYVHRPSFQNYMTLTPVLDKMNVQFYDGAGAPEYILWHGDLACLNSECDFYNDLDDKYILNEDPLTVMAIMSNYHRVGKFNDASDRPVFLMKRNPKVNTIKSQTFGGLTMHFNEWIDVPDSKSGVVKLKPEFSYTLLARLKNILYRGGILYVNYRLESGEVKRYRLNIINSQSGVWISPLLDRVPQKGQRVVQVMFETPDKNYFNNAIKAVWQYYPLEGLEVYQKKYPTFTDEKPESLSESTTICDASIDLLDVKEFKAGSLIKSFIQAKGWNVYSIEKKIPADKAWLTLTDAFGNRKYLELNTVERPDVAAHFSAPQFRESGYDIVAVTSNLKGKFNISLAIASEGKLLQCGNFSRPVTLN